MIYFYENYLNIYLKILKGLNGDWGLGIGDWGLGIGDWAQSPIPNPQSPIPIYFFLYILKYCLKILQIRIYYSNNIYIK